MSYLIAPLTGLYNCFYMKYFRFDNGYSRLSENISFEFVRRFLKESRRKRRFAEARLKIVVKQKYTEGSSVANFWLVVDSFEETASAKEGMKAKRTCRRLQHNKGWWNIV